MWLLRENSDEKNSNGDLQLITKLTKEFTLVEWNYNNKRIYPIIILLPILGLM